MAHRISGAAVLSTRMTKSRCRPRLPNGWGTLAKLNLASVPLGLLRISESLPLSRGLPRKSADCAGRYWPDPPDKP